MDTATYIGLAAGALTTVSLVPQLFKIWRSKSAKDVSTGMFATFCVGVALWLAYGIVKEDTAVIASNAAALTLAVAILVLKLKRGTR